MKVEISQSESGLSATNIEQRLNEVARQYSPEEYYVEWDEDRHMVAVRFAAGPLEHRIYKWLPLSTPRREDIEKTVAKIRGKLKDSEVGKEAKELDIELEVVWDAERQLVCVQTEKGSVLGFRAFDSLCKTKAGLHAKLSEHYMCTGKMDPELQGFQIRERDGLQLAFQWHAVTAEQTEQ